MIPLIEIKEKAVAEGVPRDHRDKGLRAKLDA